MYHKNIYITQYDENCRSEDANQSKCVTREPAEGCKPARLPNSRFIAERTIYKFNKRSETSSDNKAIYFCLSICNKYLISSNPLRTIK